MQPSVLGRIIFRPGFGSYGKQFDNEFQAWIDFHRMWSKSFETLHVTPGRWRLRDTELKETTVVNETDSSINMPERSGSGTSPPALIGITLLVAALGYGAFLYISETTGPEIKPMEPTGPGPNAPFNRERDASSAPSAESVGPTPAGPVLEGSDDLEEGPRGDRSRRTITGTR